MLFLVVTVTLVCTIAIFAWPRKHDISQETARYKILQSHRSPISAIDFCVRSRLSLGQAPQVDTFRKAFSVLDNLDSQRIYPEDKAVDLGFIYDDDLAMFLFDKNLLTNKNYQYSFPLEDVSCFSDIITITASLNRETEQGAAATP